MKTNHNVVPQFRLRTDLIAGESVEACLNNLDYWTKQLEKKCSRKSSGYAPGYAPWNETEMKPWQAGTV
jgi:hypothetical protein